MLCAFKDSRVLIELSRSERYLHGDAPRVSHLGSTIRHGITLVVERQVHVLSEQFMHIWPVEPPVDSAIFNYLVPDLPLLTRGALCKVLWRIELLDVWKGARLRHMFVIWLPALCMFQQIELGVELDIGCVHRSFQ